MSLADEYENAVRTGNNSYANYLAQILASNAGIDLNANSVTAAPASLLPSEQSSAPSSSLFGNIGGTAGGIADFLLNPFKWSPSSASADIANGAAGNSTTGAVVSGASSAIAFITDIPRVATTLLGLILIIAGIFALAQGSAARVIVNTVRSNVTS